MALPFLADVYKETWEVEKKDRDGGDQVWVCIQMNSQGLKDAGNQVYCTCTHIEEVNSKPVRPLPRRGRPHNHGRQTCSQSLHHSHWSCGSVRNHFLSIFSLSKVDSITTFTRLFKINTFQYPWHFLSKHFVFLLLGWFSAQQHMHLRMLGKLTFQNTPSATHSTRSLHRRTLWSLRQIRPRRRKMGFLHLFGSGLRQNVDALLIWVFN